MNDGLVFSKGPSQSLLRLMLETLERSLGLPSPLNFLMPTAYKIRRIPILLAPGILLPHPLEQLGLRTCHYAWSFFLLTGFSENIQKRKRLLASIRPDPLICYVTLGYILTLSVSTLAHTHPPI